MRVVTLGIAASRDLVSVKEPGIAGPGRTQRSLLNQKFSEEDDASQVRQVYTPF